MKAILHIGTGRTGTTTIQHALVENCTLLSDKGVGLLRSVGIGNNIELAKYCVDNLRNPFFRRNGIFDIAGQKRFKDEVAHKLLREVDDLRQKNYEKVLISSEHFSTDLRKHSQLVELVTLFRSSGIDVEEIIVYLREQSSYLFSEFSNRVVLGQAVEFPPKANSWSAESILNHQHTISLWEQNFPDSIMNVRLFDPSFLCSQNILEDFCGQIAPGFKLESGSGTNFSLSQDALVFFAQVNRVLEQVGGQEYGAEYEELLVKLRNFLTHSIKGNKAVPTKEFYNSVNQAFLESNEWVRRNYFSDRERLFSEPKLDHRSTVMTKDRFNDIYQQFLEFGCGGSTNALISELKTQLG